jgi:hypothetical protein
MIEADSDDSVIRLAFDVIYDHKSQVSRDNPGFTQRDVLYDRVILAIASSSAEGRKRRRPEIGNTVLGPIACGLDTEVHRTIDRA